MLTAEALYLLGGFQVSGPRPSLGLNKMVPIVENLDSSTF